MEIQIGITKAPFYDREDSYESIAVVERPYNGQSIIFCHGMKDNRADKMASSIIVNSVTERIGSGLRDGLAIEFFSGQIFREHDGKMQGQLGIFSADFESGTIVISRCTDTPYYYYRNGKTGIWDQPADNFGSAKKIHSVITEVPLEPGLLIAATSAGVSNAGKTYGLENDIFEDFADLAESEMDARDVAEYILKKAIRLDQNKPQADMSVVVVRVVDSDRNNLSKTLLKFPVPKYLEDDQ